MLPIGKKTQWLKKIAVDNYSYFIHWRVLPSTDGIRQVETG